MEKDFFELYMSHDRLALEVGHNSVADWNIAVYDRRFETQEPVIHVQSCVREEAFAAAYTALAAHFSENLGGY